MTKQSYKEYLEALENENDRFKKQVCSLKEELEEARIWDKRSLDEIIADEQIAHTSKSVISPQKIRTDNKSIGCRAFMEQYREYRKIKSEENKTREIEFDMSAIDKLKILIQKNQ